MNWNKIKQELINANQYTEVTKILSSILLIQDNYLPVRMYILDGEVCWNVSMNEAKKEAVALLNYLYNSNVVYDQKQTYENLHRFISDRLDMMLHNYANSITHRVKPKDDMDNIRSYCVLTNLLDNIDDEEWNIPQGWKLKGK